MMEHHVEQGDSCGARARSRGRIFPTSLGIDILLINRTAGDPAISPLVQTGAIGSQTELRISMRRHGGYPGSSTEYLSMGPFGQAALGSHLCIIDFVERGFDS